MNSNTIRGLSTRLSASLIVLVFFLAPVSPIKGGTNTPCAGNTSQFTQPAITNEITPEITLLARNLQNDPVKIFNFVHNKIRYVHYFGAKKGAFLTLLEGSGNDFDQSALLVSLLRAAGINLGTNWTATYQLGALQMPYESTDKVDLKNWLGLTLPQNSTNWIDRTNLIINLNYKAGYPRFEPDTNHTYYAFVPASDTNSFVFQRMWVQFINNGVTNYLDPSFKISTRVSGISIPTAMSWNTNTFLNSVTNGATIANDYVKNLNWSGLTNSLAAYTGNLLADLQGAHPNLSLEEVLGGRITEPTELSSLPNLDFPSTCGNFVTVDGATNKITKLEWQNIPASFMSQVEFTTPSFSNDKVTFSFPQLLGQKLSLTFSNNVLQFHLDDAVFTTFLHTTTNAVFTTDPTLFTKILHPFAKWTEGSTPGLVFGSNQSFRRDVDNDNGRVYERSARGYVVAYSFDNPNDQLKRRQEKLNVLLQSGLDSQSTSVITETLNVMALTWSQEVALAALALSEQKDVTTFFLHLGGRVAQETNVVEKFYVDLPLLQPRLMWRAGSPDAPDNPWRHVYQVLAFFFSGMEHGVIEQVQGVPGVSTIKTLLAANNSGKKIVFFACGKYKHGAYPLYGRYRSNELLQFR